MGYWAVEGNEGGFLPVERASETLPYELYEHVRVQKELLQLARAGELRKAISALPYVQLCLSEGEHQSYQHIRHVRVRLYTPSEQEAAFSLFAILASGYVHALSGTGREEEEGAGKIVEIPGCVAAPVRRLAMAVGRLPIWDYAGCVLSNWKVVDATRSVSLENVEILRTFTGLEAEEWFYKVHVVVEAYGGQAMAALLRARAAVKEALGPGNNNDNDNNWNSNNDSNNWKQKQKQKQRMKMRRLLCVRVQELVPVAAEVNECLKRVAASVQMMKLTFSRMPDHCKPEDFYHLVRPWLAGWPSTGVAYAIPHDTDTDTDSNGDEDGGKDAGEKCKNTGEKKRVITQVLGGGSGAQSSLLPCLDAFLGVKYAPTGSDGSRAACPGMRRFVEQLHKYRLHMPMEHCQLIQTLEREQEYGIRAFLSHCNHVVGTWYPSKKDQEMETETDTETDIETEMEMEISAFGENTQDGSCDSELCMDSIPMVHREQQRMEALKLSIELCELKRNYNQVVETLLSFRRMHVGFATLYISRQARDLARTLSPAHGEKLLEKAALGTGGSTFAKHLMRHIDDTRQCLYKIRAPPEPEIDVHERLQLDRLPEKSWYSYGIYEALHDHIDKLTSLFAFANSNDDNNDSDVDLLF